MLDLIDEYGAKLYIVISSIKSIRENKGGPFSTQHQKAKTEIETVYGDIFYVKNTVEEILFKLFPNKHENEVNENENL